ncbi:MAG: hypothetical protein LBV79_01120 [Candidatus Adiutrix sp.]|jgi:hypothetical protein|nr:hypothetical protein [Candidatus Adiutrix sp.]
MQTGSVYGSQVRDQAMQLVQAALKARLNMTEQNTIKAPPPGKGGRVNVVA